MHLYNVWWLTQCNQYSEPFLSLLVKLQRLWQPQFVKCVIARVSEYILYTQAHRTIATYIRNVNNLNAARLQMSNWNGLVCPFCNTHIVYGWHLYSSKKPLELTIQHQLHATPLHTTHIQCRMNILHKQTNNTTHNTGFPATLHSKTRSAFHFFSIINANKQQKSVLRVPTIFTNKLFGN